MKWWYWSFMFYLSDIKEMFINWYLTKYSSDVKADATSLFGYNRFRVHYVKGKRVITRTNDVTYLHPSISFIIKDQYENMIPYLSIWLTGNTTRPIPLLSFRIPRAMWRYHVSRRVM